MGFLTRFYSSKFLLWSGPQGRNDWLPINSAPLLQQWTHVTWEVGIVHIGSSSWWDNFLLLQAALHLLALCKNRQQVESLGINWHFISVPKVRNVSINRVLPSIYGGNQNHWEIACVILGASWFSFTNNSKRPILSLTLRFLVIHIFWIVAIHSGWFYSRSSFLSRILKLAYKVVGSPLSFFFHRSLVCTNPTPTSPQSSYLCLDF